jgi:hypothetical protein
MPDPRVYQSPHRDYFRYLSGIARIPHNDLNQVAGKLDGL